MGGFCLFLVVYDSIDTMILSVGLYLRQSRVCKVYSMTSKLTMESAGSEDNTLSLLL